MPTILITGGTGLLGTAISKALLEKGYEIILLSRNSRKGKNDPGANDRLSFSYWDPQKGIIDKEAIIKADHIINLAGAAIADKRWTKKRKKEIQESRIKSCEVVVNTLKETANKVRSVISVSAIGWYGPDNPVRQGHPGREESESRGFIETDPPAADFLGDTCRKWESAIAPVVGLNKRLVILRAGIVLSSRGGAFPEFIKPIRFGIAPIFGNGKQVMSWIHIEDLVRLFIEAIENEKYSGIFNAVSPQPSSNSHFMTELAKMKKGRFYIPFRIPAFLLRLFLGEMSIELLKSGNVSSKKTESLGFKFNYPSLESAFADLTDPR